MLTCFGVLQAAEGVVAVVTAADVPGVNSFIADNGAYPEEVCIFALFISIKKITVQ